MAWTQISGSFSLGVEDCWLSFFQSPGSRDQSMLCDHIWGNDLSETVTECLRKQLEQLQPLTEALGRLHLGSSPGGSGEPLASSPSRVKCVCYGLGTFASCPTARIQLAFMLLFLEKCQVSFVFLSYPWQKCMCAWD